MLRYMVTFAKQLLAFGIVSRLDVSVFCGFRFFSVLQRRCPFVRFQLYVYIACFRQYFVLSVHISVSLCIQSSMRRQLSFSCSLAHSRTIFVPSQLTGSEPELCAETVEWTQNARLLLSRTHRHARTEMRPSPREIQTILSPAVRRTLFLEDWSIKRASDRKWLRRLLWIRSYNAFLACCYYAWLLLLRGYEGRSFVFKCLTHLQQASIQKVCWRYMHDHSDYNETEVILKTMPF